MDPTLSAVIRSWSCSPLVVLGLAVSGLIYLRGWHRLRRRGARQFGALRLACFLAAMGTVYIAIESPLDALAPLVLQAHMVQHLLLMLVVPPLVWLAAPELPLLAGLPRTIQREWVVPLLHQREIKWLLAWLVQPAPAWALSIGCIWLWHIPAMYELALRSRPAHALEHLSFLVMSLLFWYPVIAPYPRQRRFSAWLLLPYLFLAGVQGTVLSGVLTFADRVLYPHYASVPRLWAVSALTDQEIAGAIMWVIGSLAYLVPLVWIGNGLLFGNLRRQTIAPLVPHGAKLPPTQPWSLALRVIASTTGKKSSDVCGAGTCHDCAGDTTRPARARFDCLRVPVIGPLLRARHTRTVCQSVLLVAAMLVILDGLLGPQVAPLNLAGVLPWTHWRGVLVLTLMFAGNFFCMVCPFTLPRRLAAAWLPADWRWPRALRNKWLAVVLLIVFFWSYELLALWDSPWWTAWIVVGYFVAASLVDGLFRGTPFCKYVCPIGQFNFVQSLVSPLQVTVRKTEVCVNCTTHDCLRGGDGIAGCEMGLLQPKKHGNFDCTFCLDCVRSCPNDNVGVLAVMPGSDLAIDTHRSGIGRLSRRADVAVLVTVLVAAAFVNAAWMTAPVVALQQWCESAFGNRTTAVEVTCALLLGLVAVPLGLIYAIAAASRRTSGEGGSSWANVGRYVFALVPMGLGMWTAHFLFHLVTGGGTIVAAASRFVADVTGSTRAAIDWACPCCNGEMFSWILPVELLLLDAGLLLSLYLAYNIARREHGRTWRALSACGPWLVFTCILFVLGVAILLAPMQMRGTMVVVAGGSR